MATLLCDGFIDLGGVYVKFLQGVMLKSELFKQWDVSNRLNVFENLDSEPINLHAILRHELGDDKMQQFRTIQPQPFAAGSFGQVYYGELQDGRSVIIKVLRPKIRELLKYDLMLLGWFSRQFLKFYTTMDMQLDQALSDFSKATMNETDYIAEAQFANEMYVYYKNHPSFVIPETHRELCTSNIIVQEYIDGVSAAHLVRLAEQGVDVKEYVQETIGSDLDAQLQTLGYETIAGMFDLSRIQGDPHPGNVRLMSDNRVGLIDFGIAAPAPKNKAALFCLIEEWNRLYVDGENISKLFEQFMRFFVSDLYNALRRIGKQAGSMSDETLSLQIGSVAQESMQQMIKGEDLRVVLQDGRILQIAQQTVNKNNRFGIVMKLEASEVLRASQTYLTLIEGLGRRAEVMPRVFDQVVREVGARYPEMRHQADDSMSMHEALDIVSRWLERVAERDPVLFRQLMQRIKLGQRMVK